MFRKIKDLTFGITLVITLKSVKINTVIKFNYPCTIINANKKNVPHKKNNISKQFFAPFFTLNKRGYLIFFDNQMHFSKHYRSSWK